MSMDKLTIISIINHAFHQVELDDGIGLSEADAIDDHRELQYRLECKKNDEKKTWTIIPSPLLNQYYCSLSYFDAKGMRFHLPAFMVAR
jgi:hypothetical protein